MRSDLYRCRDCGQTFRITTEGTMCTLPILYSPCCGEQLDNVKSAFDSLDAPCFNNAPRILHDYFYKSWRAFNAGHRRYVDFFLRAVITSKGE